MASQTPIGSWPLSSCLHNLQRFWSHMTPRTTLSCYLNKFTLGKKTCVIFTWLWPKNELICFFPNSSLNESLETTCVFTFPHSKARFFIFGQGIRSYDLFRCETSMVDEVSLHLGWSYFIDLTWSIMFELIWIIHKFIGIDSNITQMLHGTNGISTQPFTMNLSAFHVDNYRYKKHGGSMWVNIWSKHHHFCFTSMFSLHLIQIFWWTSIWVNIWYKPTKTPGKIHMFLFHLQIVEVLDGLFHHRWLIGTRMISTVGSNETTRWHVQL